jgi:hypothetical protein
MKAWHERIRSTLGACDLALFVCLVVSLGVGLVAGQMDGARTPFERILPLIAPCFGALFGLFLVVFFPAVYGDRGFVWPLPVTVPLLFHAGVVLFATLSQDLPLQSSDGPGLVRADGVWLGWGAVGVSVLISMGFMSLTRLYWERSARRGEPAC